MESLVPYVVALVPTVGIATLFYFIMKNIIEGDRKERLAQARWEAEQKAAESKSAEQRADS
jgi:hypothetical protein